MDKGFAARRRYFLLKRLMDVALSAAGLILASPLLLLLLLANVVVHGWPPVFTQYRPGKGGQIFPLLKLRSMTDDKDASGCLLPDEQRLTKFGKFMRETSLDELPELLNVLRGHMSLVGPRPLLPQYLQLYSAEQARRHEVLPGLTGWAQVNGRNAASWTEKFELDVWYIDNASVLLDIRILMKTVVQVVRRRGISEEGEATVRYFTGNHD